jgi:hypothetical protein
VSEKKIYELDADAKRRLEHISGPMRELLLELYQHAMRNENSPEFQRRRVHEQREKEEKDVEHLESMTDKALGGVYGKLGKQCAERVTRNGTDRSVVTISELRRQLRRIPGRQSG